MDMSTEGKKYIDHVLADSDVKTLRFYGMPDVGLEEAKKNDDLVTIEGIQVAIDPIIKHQLDGVTIHAEKENGEIGLLLVGFTPAIC